MIYNYNDFEHLFNIINKCVKDRDGKILLEKLQNTNVNISQSNNFILYIYIKQYVYFYKIIQISIYILDGKKHSSFAFIRYLDVFYYPSNNEITKYNKYFINVPKLCFSIFSALNLLF